MERTREIFGELADDLIHGIVVAMERDYAANADRHDESIGDDGQSFGWLVAHSAANFLEQELGAIPGIAFSRPLNSFQAELRDVVLHPCKTGSEFGDDVHVALLDGSLSRQRFVAENAEQLTLFHGNPMTGWEPSTAEGPRLRHLVIAHCGNPRDGLCWICVGAPHADGRSGSPWYWIEEIHRTQYDADHVLVDSDATQKITPFDEMDEPEPSITVDESEADEVLDQPPA